MGITLGDGEVVVVPPHVPHIRTEPPGPLDVVVVPKAGPKGEQGDPGPPGPPADLSDVQQRVDDAMTVHVIDPEPHPAYDDMPSLTLLFENRLV